jgi:hypothetical protein
MTNVLLFGIFCAVVVDAWITNRWLREARRVLVEIQKQAAEIAFGDNEEN